MTQDDLRSVIRELLAEELGAIQGEAAAATAAVRAEEVSIDTDDALGAFVKRILELAADDTAGAGLEQGRHVFRLADVTRPEGGGGGHGGGGGAARRAIAVSAARRATISPGDCSRSTAAAPSSMAPGWVASRCIDSAEHGLPDRFFIQPSESDHDQLAFAFLAKPPVPVAIALQPGTDHLDHFAARFSRPVEEAFDAQDIVFGRRLAQPFVERVAIGDRAR